MAGNPRIVTEDVTFTWDGATQRLPRGQVIDVPAGSALEQAIGPGRLAPLAATAAQPAPAPAAEAAQPSQDAEDSQDGTEDDGRASGPSKRATAAKDDDAGGGAM